MLLLQLLQLVQQHLLLLQSQSPLLLLLLLLLLRLRLPGLLLDAPTHAASCATSAPCCC